MNIYVCIKQVPDTEANLIVKEGTTVNEADIKWIIGPYDEYALEEALKLKEKISGSTVTIITLGPQRVESAIRSGLAMGAEKATHIETDKIPDHKTIAKALANGIKKEGEFGVIFMGKQAIDDDSYLTHLYLGEYLEIPTVTNVIAFDYNEGKVTIEREIDEGAREKIEMEAPCIIGATKGLNTPRYASLMGIMKAKKIPVNKLTLEDLGVNASYKIKTEKLFAPPEKPQGKVIEGEIEDSVKELVRLLKEEAKVL
jgi:electron transfer flavoprotein beta subunit